mgnify:CR=1 FL=1
MNLNTHTTFQPSGTTAESRYTGSVAGLTADNSFCVQRFSGEIDMASAADFAAALDRVLSGRPECVVLDMSRISFFGTSGLPILARFASDAADLHIPVAMVCPRVVARPLEACRLTDFIAVYETVEAAGTALNAPR